MGQNESNPVRNMDKRTARREHRDNFSAAISCYRNRRMNHEHENDNNDKDEEEGGRMDWDTGTIRVCVRKRPIFKDEISHFEFDVVTCVNNKTVVVHDARMHSDMKRMFLNHYQFQFDRIFNERTNNDVVYLETAAPMTQFAVEGGFATCLMYGQTGSGKTYTMTSIYERAAIDIFRRISGGNFSVSVSFCEISGDNCSDLLNSFNPAQLLTGRDGGVYCYPLVEPLVSTEDELLAFITFGCRVRTTAATGVHDSSSRSHALLKIYIKNNDSFVEGVLTLVDLAGSEHKIDSMYHSAERRKEGAAINSSLMALKECVRAKAAGKDLSHFYRKSKLTMALKSSFTDPTARTTVIVTVSPASKDTEHSLNSLRHACIMDGQEAPAQNNNSENRFVTGGDLTVEWIGEINITSIAKKNRGQPEELKTSNGNTFGNNAQGEDKPLSDKEKLQMRRSAERVALKSLTPSMKALLKSSRELLGAVYSQQMRLTRFTPLMQSQVEVAEYFPPPVVTGEDLYWRPADNSSNFSNNLKMEQPQQPSHALPPPETTGNKERRSVRKLRMSIYGSDDGVSEDMKRRQFGALLKQNGYSKAEIEVILQKEINKDQNNNPALATPIPHPNSIKRDSIIRSQSSQSQSPSTSTSSSSSTATSSNRIHTMSAGSMRPGVDQQQNQESLVSFSHAAASPPNNSMPTTATSATLTPPQASLSRHEAAKLRRLQLESENAAKKGNMKIAAASSSSTFNPNSNHAIAALEAELQDPNLTSAARHGLMKRIATMKSVVVREERWKEQERREAEKQTKQMKLAAAAEEAKKRLGIPSTSPIQMKNTTHIEGILSPRAPLENAKSVVNSKIGPFGEVGEVGLRKEQSVSQMRAIQNNPLEEVRSDSLDHWIQRQSAAPSEQEQLQRVPSRGKGQGQGYGNGNGRGGGRYSHGASSAPFANDMNWDK